MVISSSELQPEKADDSISNVSTDSGKLICFSSEHLKKALDAICLIFPLKVIAFWTLQSINAPESIYITDSPILIVSRFG